MSEKNEGKTTEWRLRPFFATPWIPIFLILLIASFGLILPLFILIWFGHSRRSRRIWIQEGRLFDDRHLPQEGVDLAGVRAKLTSVSLFGLFTIERGLVLTYLNPLSQRPAFLSINQLSYGAHPFGEALQAITEGIANAQTSASVEAREAVRALEQIEEGQKITPRRALRGCLVLLSLPAFGFVILLQLVTVPEKQQSVSYHASQLKDARATLAKETVPHLRSKIEEEMEEIQRRLSDYRVELWIQRGVQGAAMALGLLALFLFRWLRPPQPIAA